MGWGTTSGWQQRTLSNNYVGLIGVKEIQINIRSVYRMAHAVSYSYYPKILLLV